MPFRKPPKTAFKPGNPGGPGRPRGARSKLQELAVELLHEDFAEHGAEVIARVRERKPEVYLASVVSLLPKQSQIERRTPFNDISDEELALLQEHLTAARAKTVARGLSLLPAQHLKAMGVPRRTNQTPLQLFLDSHLGMSLTFIWRRRYSRAAGGAHLRRAFTASSSLSFARILRRKRWAAGQLIA